MWSYTLNNDTDAVQGLAANEAEAVVERFAVRAADGTRGEVVITVNGANDAPTVTATGPATAVAEGDHVTLTGTGSDPDRQDRLRYQWTPPAGIPTSGLLPSATSARITFVAPELIDGTDLAFTLTVTDSSGTATATATATVTVMVTAENDAAVFGGTRTGRVTESSATENNAQRSLAFGLLTVTDSDGPNRFAAQTGVAGTYGTFTLFAAGNWRYDLDNDLSATNALAAPVAGTDLATERFPVQQATEGATEGTVDPAGVVITITGVNDAPTVLAGDDRIVRETVAVTLTGTGTDPESAPAALTYAWTQTGGTPTVTLTNADTATATFTAPDLTEDMSLTFTLTVTDPQSAEGTDTVVIVVDGVANRPASITGDRTGTVTEDAPATVVNGQLAVSDTDDGDSTDVQLQGDSLGTYGTFTVATGGLWTYTLNNADPETNALAGGDRGTERFTVATGDGTEVLVAITVIGADDLPTAITGQTTGRVTEDAVVVETTGTLAVTDPDGPAGAAAFQAQGSVVGIYGTFTLAANGEWTYTLDNADPETNALAADATATDVFTAVAADDTGLTQVITITITGAAAPVVVGGQLTGSTTEDEFTDDGFNEINGFLSATDPDNPGLRYTFRLAPGDFQGTYGTFTLGGVGPPRWRYRLDNADPDTDLLTAGETGTDTFTLTVEDADGTRITLLQDEDGNAIDTLAVTITIVGTDDPPTISGALTGAVTEDSDEDRTTGLLTVTAVDNADLVTAFTEQADVPGTYGSFTLTEDGAWTYALENADPATNALAAGVTRSDVFTVVFAADTSVTQAVTITVTGANDAPTANAGPDQPAVTAGATVTLDGSGSSDPDTGDAIATYTWTQTGGTTVTLSDNSAMPTFTAPAVATDLTFSLIVNDGRVDSAADTVTITVTDDVAVDGAGIVLLPEDLTVYETRSASYNVSLSEAPLGPVAVAIVAMADGADLGDSLTLTPPTLTFNESTWNVGQAVTVAAAAGILPADGSSSLTLDIVHRASGGGYNNVEESLELTVRPQPGRVQTFTAAPAARGGRVVLRWEAPANAGVAEVTHYELQRRARSATDFEPLETLPVGSTTTQFVLPRRTSVTSFEFRIRALAAGVVGEWVSTDPSPGALLSVSTLLEIVEGGTATYTVVLQTVPTASVTVVISSNDADVTTNVPATGLTFTVDNWDMPQAVIVTAAQDADAIDDVGISLTHDFEGGGYRSVSARVDVSVVDDDTAQLSVVAAPVTEGGTATVSVSLDRAVAEGFTVNFATQEGGTATVIDDYTATSGTLTFAGSAGEVQTFTVATVQDEIAETAETVQVSLSGLTPSDLPIDITGVTNVDVVTITDDDPAFSTTTVAAQTYTVGMDIGSVILPTATGGNGALTYTLAPLPDGLMLTDNMLSGIPVTPQAATNLAYTVTDGDGNTDTIDFTITITAITITGDTTGMVTEGGVEVATSDTAAGRLDNPAGDFVSQAGATDRANGQGAYGRFTLATGGAWTYTLDNEDDDTNALPVGATVTDIFTAVSRANAGVTQAVTITVTGANDAPTADAGDARTVPQGSTVALIGSGTDPDTGDVLTYAWTQTGGTPTVTFVPGMDDTTVNFTAPEVDANTPLTFTLTVTDRQTAADTDTVMVTINAGSTASDITGDIFGGITEDAAPNTATGVLTVTDGAALCAVSGTGRAGRPTAASRWPIPVSGPTR